MTRSHEESSLLEDGKGMTTSIVTPSSSASTCSRVRWSVVGGLVALVVVCGSLNGTEQSSHAPDSLFAAVQTIPARYLFATYTLSNAGSMHSKRNVQAQSSYIKFLRIVDAGQFIMAFRMEEGAGTPAPLRLPPACAHRVSNPAQRRGPTQW